MVRLSLDSNPTGATVYGPDGAEIGKAPITVDWKPAADPVKLTFKLRGYRDKTVDITVTKNTVMQAELSKIRVAAPPQQQKQPEEPKHVNGMTGRDGLERPD